MIVTEATSRSPRPVLASSPRPGVPLLVLDVGGSERDIGRAHGELVRGHGGADALLGFYPELPQHLLLGGLERGTERMVRRLGRPLLAEALRRMERARPEPFRARTRAFFEALGRPEQARFLTVMDVFQNVVGLAGRLPIGGFGRMARSATPMCSTSVVWGAASADGTLRHARNFDFPGIGVWDPTPVVVFVSPDEPGTLRHGFVTTRGADVPGVTVFNEAGLVLTAHTRFHREVTFDGAAVVDLGHEIARRARSLADAIRIARERRVASTWGLCVSSASERRAVVLELHAGGVEVVEPRRGEALLTCANRYRHPRMQVGEVAASPAWGEHSDARERRMRELLEAARARGGATVEDLWALLDDHVDPDAPGVPRTAGGVVRSASTVQSVVVEPEAGAIWVSVGRVPASAGPWQRIEWRWEGAGARTVAPEGARGGRPVEPAMEAFVEAVRIDVGTHDKPATAAALERAVGLSPADASLRLLAGGLSMRLGRVREAGAHFDAGLDSERAPFRRGQLLLWASRAADASGDAPRAAALRAELAATSDPRLWLARADAEKDAGRPWTSRRARRAHAFMLQGDVA